MLSLLAMPTLKRVTRTDERRVMSAEPFVRGRLSSTGDARYMAIQQYRFPDTYDERDTFTRADHDRCEDWGRGKCFEKHTGTGPYGFVSWLQHKDTSRRQIFDFLKEILEADPEIKWTGYRIMGSVKRSNGFLILTLELFAKHPDSDTRVYSGNQKSPNVLDVWRRTSLEQRRRV